MSVDLHTHSRYSDGSDSPTEVVDAALSAGLTAVALTDHDTLEGTPEAIDAGSGHIDVIPGVEISVTIDVAEGSRAQEGDVGALL